MKTIEQVAAAIDAAPVDANVKVVGSIPAGKHIRQGDVQVCAPRKGRVTLADGTSIEVAPGKIVAQGEDVQVAVGQNVGARHVVRAASGVTVYAPAEAHALIGPVVVVEEGAEALLTHPEHCHFRIGPGMYQVTFQRDYMQEEIRRVQD